MFKYVKFTKVEAEFSVLEFKGGVVSVTVNVFDTGVVSLESTVEADIDALIAQQPTEISATVILKDEFKALVTNSAQLKRIREVVKTEIAKKYDVADEVAQSKRDPADAKRVAYEAYVQECLSLGFGLKAEIGY